MRAEGGVAGAPVAPDRNSRRSFLLGALATAVVWLAGSGIVALAQHGSDRKVAALGAAGAGIVAILVLGRLTADRERGYLRSVVGATIAVSVVAEWLLWHLGTTSTSSGFVIDGLVKRIALPELIVVLLPVVAREVWLQGAAVLRAPRGMDWIVAAYATVVLVPALAVGVLHHNRLLYIGQDLGLIVFFCFMYLVGRAVTAEAAHASAAELVDVLLLLGVAPLMLVSWNIFPIYVYVEAAAAGALAVLVLRPRAARLLPVGLAIALLALDVEQIKAGTNASTAVELAGALAILAYLALRARRLVPQWLLVALALVAVAGFLGLTSDGATLRGQYYGPDASNAGRTYEAHAVRAAIGHSLSAVLGRGLGGTIDESAAPPAFERTLVYGGRDPAHVQEIHLLFYSFLLKTGFLGLAWLAAFLAGLTVLVFKSLERAARERDPSLVLYAALPLLAIAQATADASRLQANPLNGLSVGILVTVLAARRAAPVPLRAHAREFVARREVLVGAAFTLAGCVAVGYLSAHRAPVYAPVATAPSQPVSLWIGDSYTIGEGATSSAVGEAIATSSALGWQTDLDAEEATGFVANGHSADRRWKPIPDRLRKDAKTFSPPPPSVVVLDAGRYDRRVPPGQLRQAALKSFRLLAKGFPWSAIVVIAPFTMRSKPTSYLALRQLEKREAKRRGWAFVDPIAEGWINRHSAKLVQSDHNHPNQRGYDYIVAHLAPAIEHALNAAHEHVRPHCTNATPCRGRAPKAH